jgi:hypothetical protein
MQLVGPPPIIRLGLDLGTIVLFYIYKSISNNIYALKSSKTLAVEAGEEVEERAHCTCAERLGVARSTEELP